MFFLFSLVNKCNNIFCLKFQLSLKTKQYFFSLKIGTFYVCVVPPYVRRYGLDLIVEKLNTRLLFNLKAESKIKDTLSNDLNQSI